MTRIFVMGRGEWSRGGDESRGPAMPYPPPSFRSEWVLVAPSELKTGAAFLWRTAWVCQLPTVSVPSFALFISEGLDKLRGI